MAKIFSFHGEDVKYPIWQRGRDWYVSQDKFLKSTLVVTLILALSTPIIVGSILTFRQNASQDNFSYVLTTWRNYLTGGDYDTSNAELMAKITPKLNDITQNARKYRDAMLKTPDRKSLYADIPTIAQGYGIGYTYSRLEDMALSYSTKGALTDPAEKEQMYLAIKDGLIWMNTNWYNKDKCSDNIFVYAREECGSTFQYEIASASPLSDTIVLLYDRLKQDPEGDKIIQDNMDAIKRFYVKTVGDHDTGGNLAMADVILLKRAAISQDNEALNMARANYEFLLKYSTSGDGLYQDGSFIQHKNHAYNDWYGLMFLGKMIDLSYIFKGLGYDSNSQKIYQWYKDAYKPLIVNNAAMDMVKGRVATYPRASVLANTISMEPLLTLSRIISGADYQDLGREIIKKSGGNISGKTINSVIWANDILKDPSLAGDSQVYDIAKIFPRMDKAVIKRQDFSLAISMSSSRTYNFEYMHEENGRSWFISDGALFLYNSVDKGQFNDNFWATVNPYMIPGTTEDTRVKAYGEGNNYLSPKRYAGGTTMDNYLAAAMVFKSYGSNPTNAKKSWFVFDDEIVALGTGISNKSENNVKTTVENRKIRDDGSNRFVVNGNLINNSSVNVIASPQWAFLEGTGGYYFPAGSKLPATINTLKEARVGKWSNVTSLRNSLPGDPSFTRSYQEIWFDHGANPVGARYAYVILPNKSEADTKAYSSNPDIKIIANTPSVQGVLEKKLNIYGFNFYYASIADYLQSEGAASVILKKEGNKVRVAISDPRQYQQTLKIHIKNSINSPTYNKKYMVTKADPGISAQISDAEVILTVNVSNARGKTFNLELSESGSITSPQSIQPSSVIINPSGVNDDDSTDDTSISQGNQSQSEQDYERLDESML